MKSVGLAVRGLNVITRVFAGGMLLLMTFLLFVDIVARNLFGVSFVGTSSLATYLMVWLTFLGAAFIVPTHGHVAIDIVLRFAGIRFKRLIVGATAIVGMVTAAYMGVLGYRLTLFIFSTGQIETTTNIRAGFLYVAVPLGMALMLLNYAELLVATIRKDDTRLPSADVPVVQADENSSPKKVIAADISRSDA